jgi:cellular nucleic acid-binding protein
MDRDDMRKRGWSIHSEASEMTNNTAAEQPELSEAQKRALLDNYPQPPEDDRYMQEPEGEQPTLKKIRTEQYQREESFPPSTISPKLLEQAKSRLSKWAARLFDPNRPRGLIEPPKTIPLNDEFLIAFGKREREFDERIGRAIAVDLQEIAIEAEDNDDQDDAPAEENYAGPIDMERDFGEIEGRKLKIANLAYTTSQETLINSCSAYGPVVEVNLIMDKEKPDLNAGRAYVTFERPDDAQECMGRMTSLEHRSLRISMAEAIPHRSHSKSTGGGLPTRYFEKDITTKCFRCNQVGHIEANCPNPAIPKPCPLCGKTDHDMRDCTLSKVCFRCGVPGHINRECQQPQAPPKRIVCGNCFQSGHHRVSCRRGPTLATDVKCMVCNRMGHFMCREMKWFFGLDGLSCFNCGRNGHHGYDCDRPPLEVCARDESVAKVELERAQAVQL